jgi:hypothetical protein
VYSGQFAVYSGQFAVYSGQFAVYSGQFAVYSGQFAVYSGRGRIPPSTKVLLSDIMGLKPISMEMFLKPGFCPPVTGYDGRSRPVANRYDTSRTFPRVRS